MKKIRPIMWALVAVVVFTTGVGYGANHHKVITETHDAARGITCYTYGADGISCIPDQWLDSAAPAAETE